LLGESEAREGFISAEALESIARHLTPDMAVAVKMLFALAWRKSEVLGLQWSEVGLETGAVHLAADRCKDGRKRDGYLDPATLALLVQHRARVTAWEKQTGVITPYVFPGPVAGQPVQDFVKSWRTATKRSGYAGTLVHDLRRSAIKDMIKSGTPEKVCMQASGHATRHVFERYHVVNDQDLRDAVARRAQFRHIQPSNVVALAR